MAVGEGGLLRGMIGGITVLMVPIMLLNMFGGIVAGIWLVVLGEWWALGYGLALLIVSTFALSFVLMPGMFLFAAPGAFLLSRRSALAYPFLGLSALYVIAVMTGWCLWVYQLYMQRADARSFFPLLLWSYGTATGPWTFMASKEPDNTASMVSAFAAQLGYILMIVMSLFFEPSPLDLLKAFGSVMLLALTLQVGVAITGKSRVTSSEDFGQLE